MDGYELVNRVNFLDKTIKGKLLDEELLYLCMKYVDEYEVEE
jgi:hypothetical protein